MSLKLIYFISCESATHAEKFNPCMLHVFPWHSLSHFSTVLLKSSSCSVSWFFKVFCASFKASLQISINLDSNPIAYMFVHDTKECAGWLLSCDHFSTWKFINFIIVPAFKFPFMSFNRLATFIVKLCPFWSTIYIMTTFRVCWHSFNTTFWNFVEGTFICTIGW